MTAPTAETPTSLTDFMEGVYALKASPDGYFDLKPYDAYLLNIILRWASEENLALEDTDANRDALFSINADLAVLNSVLTDEERGRALAQFGIWAQTDGWIKDYVGRLSNTINACKIQA